MRSFGRDGLSFSTTGGSSHTIEKGERENKGGGGRERIRVGEGEREKGGGGGGGGGGWGERRGKIKQIRSTGMVNLM